jgi:hypothetical protein
MKRNVHSTAPRRSGAAVQALPAPHRPAPLRALLILAAFLALAIALLPALSAAAAPSETFPKIIQLPDGFQPEGIATGRGHSFYVGSIAGGAIYAGDLRTGMGQVIVPARADRTALGIAVDQRSNYLFVAGGPLGAAYVYDLESGDDVGVYQFFATLFAGVVNDVVVTRDAAYFTDSFRPVLYRVPLGPGGELAANGAFDEIALNGIPYEPGQFNANGIVATPDGKSLFIVNSFFGTLYKVDPGTGDAMEIDLGGDTVQTGDGLVLDGHTLYVVQNTMNKIGVTQLDPTFTSGTVLEPISDIKFRVPTTAAQFGDDLYAVNARFDVAPPQFPAYPPLYPGVEFDVVKVSKH